MPEVSQKDLMSSQTSWLKLIWFINSSLLSAKGLPFQTLVNTGYNHCRITLIKSSSIKETTTSGLRIITQVSWKNLRQLSKGNETLTRVTKLISISQRVSSELVGLIFNQSRTFPLLALLTTSIATSLTFNTSIPSTWTSGIPKAGPFF